VRRFTADYLRRTREGMWDGARAALSDLELTASERLLDVGAGTGELSRVLAAESGGDVVWEFHAPHREGGRESVYRCRRYDPEYVEPLLDG